MTEAEKLALAERIEFAADAADELGFKQIADFDPRLTIGEARALVSALRSRTPSVEQVERIKVQNHCLYEALEHIEETVEKTKEWAEQCSQRRVFAESKWRAVALENAMLLDTARLREVLRPFKALADHYDDRCSDDGSNYLVNISLKDCRAARAVLALLSKPVAEGETNELDAEPTEG
jgi:hypothetical protein